jgi:sugar (pentulose or hexulose) kinase
VTNQRLDRPTSGARTKAKSRRSVVVTLDMGGSSAKASAFDAASGTNIGCAKVMYRPVAHQGDASEYVATERLQNAYGALEALVSAVGSEPRSYLGITVGAARGPFVLLDHSGDVVPPTLLNSDKRPSVQAARLRSEVGAEDLYRLTGQWPAVQWGLPRLLWFRETFPDAWRRTRTVAQLHDWILYKLSGELVSEPSSAAMSQMLDVSKREWSARLLEGVGISLSLLPPLTAPGTRVGALLPSVAATTGLPAGLPVHVGGGDTHLSAMSVGACSNPRPVVVMGSTTPAQVAQRFDDVPFRSEVFYPCLVSEQLRAGWWALETNAGPTGNVIEQLEGLGDQTGDSLKAELMARGFTILALADDSPLTVLAGNPFFGWESWSRHPGMMVVGLRPTHSGDSVRAAAQRGACLAVTAILRCLEAASPAGSAEIIATGGHSESAMWCQLLSDYSGREVRVLPMKSVAGLAGAAIVSGADPRGFIEGIPSTCYLPSRTDSVASSMDLVQYLTVYHAVQENILRREADI